MHRPPSSSSTSCRHLRGGGVRGEANCKGFTVVDSASKVAASGEERCDQYLADPECNTWVSCASADGCYEPYH